MQKVAVNKSRYDERISKQMEEMYNFFPRVDVLAKVYEPEKNIAQYIVTMHRNIVLFAVDAAEYFSKKSGK